MYWTSFKDCKDFILSVQEKHSFSHSNNSKLTKKTPAEMKLKYSGKFQFKHLHELHGKTSHSKPQNSLIQLMEIISNTECLLLISENHFTAAKTINLNHLWCICLCLHFANTHQHGSFIRNYQGLSAVFSG